MRRIVPLAMALTVAFVVGCGTKPAPQQAQPASSQPQQAPAQPQTQAATKDFRSTDQAKKVAAIAMDKSDDKAKKLAEAAKAAKETEVTVYTSMNLEDSTPLIDGFTKWLDKQFKIKAEVNLWRASSEKVLQRGVVEAQGDRFEVDVFESNSPELEVLSRETVTTQFWVPSFKDYPEAARDPKGYWHATRFNFFTAAYNTKLVKPEDVPKSYEDLLDPKWKGKMAIDTEDWDWFSTLVKQGPWGSEEKALAFFKKLSAQELQQRTGHTLISELVSSGEVPIAITIYNHQGQKLVDKGAPIQWLPLEPVVARPNGVALAANAKNPNLGLLFIEYCLSLDGQGVLLKQGRVPANPKVDSKLNKGFKYVNADPAAVIDEAKKWEALYKETLFGKQ